MVDLKMCSNGIFICGGLVFYHSQPQNQQQNVNVKGKFTDRVCVYVCGGISVSMCE